MSRTIHDAIVVTAWRSEYINKARAKAVELGLLVTGVVDSELNGFVSFMIAPDGSHVGWAAREVASAARKTWCDWAREQWRLRDDDPRADDVGAYLYWVHVQYGEVRFEGDESAAIEGVGGRPVVINTSDGVFDPESSLNRFGRRP